MGKYRGRLRGLKIIAVLLMAFSLLTPSFAFVQAEGVSKSEASEVKPKDKIEVQLQEQFEESDVVSFIVQFKEKADTKSAKNNIISQNNANNLSAEEMKLQQRVAVISELKVTASNSQDRVLSFLREQKRIGNVKEFQSFFIINGIGVKGTKDVAEKIATFPEVEEIFLDPVIQTGAVKVENIDERILPNNFIEWNIDRVNAPAAWDAGFDGTGVVVAVLDTGAQWNHPALKNNYRGYNQSTGAVDHTYSWFDPINKNYSPYDDHGHGTHVTGTVVGTEPDGSPSIGAAPGAKWIGVKILDENGRGFGSDMVKGAEWIMAPGGRADLAPDIVNNSWGSSSGLNEWFRGIVQSWIDAGIFPVFAAGNEDYEHPNGPKTIHAPANYPESFAVGSTNYDDEHSYFSFQGPSPYGHIKPDVVAPGESIVSSVPGSSYGIMFGTSMATPTVAGVAALVKQANPSLNLMEIADILKETATPLTDENNRETPNNAYGHGLVNAYEAVQLAKNKENKSVERLRGASRFDTAVEISKAGWMGSSIVVLARSDDYADALAGVPLAHYLNAPILLTRPTYLPQETLDEIKRLGANTVIVLGGKLAISDDIVETLEKEGLYVERISGSSRTATAVEIANFLTYYYSEKAIIVNGFDFPDALSVASQAAIEGIPILLTHANRLSEPTAEALQSLGVKETIVVGGKTAVSDEVMSQLPNPVRVSGSDRVATNIAVQKHFNVNPEHIYVATGNNFADSLTGAVLAAKKNSSILLVRNSLFDVTKDYITESRIKKITILGGTTAVNEKIRTDLEHLLK